MVERNTVNILIDVQFILRAKLYNIYITSSIIGKIIKINSKDSL